MKDVPKQTHLHPIGNRYYFRARVPLDLIEAYGGKREYKKALGTSDYQEALILVRAAAAEFDRRNAALRARAKGAETATTDQELLQVAIEWLAEEETRFANRPPIERQDLDEIVDSLEYIEGELTEAVARADYVGEQTVGIVREAKQILEGKGIELRPEGARFQAFCRLMVEANVESVRRQVARLRKKPFRRGFDPQFDVVVPARVPVAVGQPERNAGPALTFEGLAARYLDRPTSMARTQKTRDKDKAAFDLFADILGKDRPLAAISADDCNKVHVLISRLPPNFTKRFPNRTIDQVIERAEKDGLTPISIQTQRSYLTRLRTLFAYAVKAGYIDRNPAAIVELPRDDIPSDEKRSPFTIPQLERIFSAPLYTGCINDEWGVHRPGPLVVRRGRFWVPLIALWTGMRLNECCQLTTDDVSQVGDVWTIRVRPDKAEGKSVKTPSGRRFVPVHSELIRVGFAQFVRDQRDAGGRLFPELQPDALGYYSGPFSKWFAYFLGQIGIDDRLLTFHSFRHTFADALREADISPERQDRLGGWSVGQSTRRDYGDGGSAATLSTELEKVRFPGLDLSHLYLSENPNRVQTSRRISGAVEA